jgi:hypothetical protein
VKTRHRSIVQTRLFGEVSGQPDAGGVVELMTVPATVGELWIVGYLIVFGVRRSVPTQ